MLPPQIQKVPKKSCQKLYQDLESWKSYVLPMNVKGPRILSITHATTHQLDLLLTVVALWMPYTNSSLHQISVTRNTLGFKASLFSVADK